MHGVQIVCSTALILFGTLAHVIVHQHTDKVQSSAYYSQNHLLMHSWGYIAMQCTAATILQYIYIYIYIYIYSTSLSELLNCVGMEQTVMQSAILCILYLCPLYFIEDVMQTTTKLRALVYSDCRKLSQWDEA